MFLRKISENKYSAIYPSDLEAEAKVKVGDELRATKARNPMFHRKGMALLHLAFHSQDKYDDFRMFRQSVLLEIGFYKIGKNLHGEETCFVDSMSFEEMSEERFEEFYNSALTVISKMLETSPEDVQSELMGYY